MPLMQQWFPITLVVALHASIFAWLLQSNPLKKTTPPEVMEIMFFTPQEAAPEAPSEPLPVPPPPPQVKPEPPKVEKKVEKKVERPPVIDTPSPVVAEEPVVVPTPEPAPPQPQPQPQPKVETPKPVAQPSAKPTAPMVDASHRGNRKPNYPAVSRRLGEEGVVMVRVLVKADGTAGDVRLEQSSGFPRLDQSAVDAVKRWKFKPGMRGTTPVDEWFSIPVEFNLEN